MGICPTTWCENARLRQWVAMKMRIVGFLEAYLAPLASLAVRFHIGWVFLASGLLKYNNWSTTITLYTYEHPVPGLSPEIAAYLGTFGELFFPVLLFLGLGARIGALGLLAMTAVIELTYQHSLDHMVWALFLGIILTYGPGRLSLDHWLRKHCVYSCDMKV